MLTLLLLSGLFLNLFVLLLEHGTRVYLVGPWKLLMSTWLHHTLPTCAPPPNFPAKNWERENLGTPLCSSTLVGSVGPSDECFPHCMSWASFW